MSVNDISTIGGSETEKNGKLSNEEDTSGLVEETVTNISKSFDMYDSKPVPTASDIMNSNFVAPPLEFEEM